MAGSTYEKHEKRVLLPVFSMCLSLLLGAVPVTAYAAAEQSDVYLIGYNNAKFQSHIQRIDARGLRM